METPTRADLARFDRSRKNKKTSNKDWKSPQDPDAKIAKMKDGRTHLAHKAEHGVDMDTGAIVSVTVQDASDGDTATLPQTLIMAAEQVELVQPDGQGVEEMVADKGYHSDETLVGLREVGVRSHVSEPERGRRCWQDKKTGETPPEKRAAQKALYANRRRVRGRRGRRLQRCRGEVVERTFAHMYETGDIRDHTPDHTRPREEAPDFTGRTAHHKTAPGTHNRVGEKPGATTRKSCGFRPRRAFLRHTRRVAGRSPPSCPSRKGSAPAAAVFTGLPPAMGPSPDIDAADQLLQFLARREVGDALRRHVRPVAGPRVAARVWFTAPEAEAAETAETFSSRRSAPAMLPNTVSTITSACFLGRSAARGHFLDERRLRQPAFAHGSPGNSDTSRAERPPAGRLSAP